MTVDELDHYISDYILRRNPLQSDIPGAPFRIGQEVEILENPSKDETFYMKFARQIGHVSFFEYDCGCGQTFPEDPMIGVIFNNGDIGEFWREELTTPASQKL